jgi:membrane fusion protein (multidrug efflux system)
MEETKEPVNNHRRKILAISVFLVIALIGALAVFFYIQYKATHISTDDAFVEGRIHAIASKVPGTVNAVYVKDNQPVMKGDLLMEIDPADYEVKVNEASSGFHAEQAKVAEIDAKTEALKKQIVERKAAAEAARAHLELQEANLRQAEIDMKRAEALYQKDVISKERYEKISTGQMVAVAQVKAAREQLKQAETASETQKAMVRQAEASRTAQLSSIAQKEAVLKTAQLNSGYTKLYAPSDGYITKKSVEVGNQIQGGQPLMAVVPLNDIWIVANYKETQLGKVKAGQKVEIKVDSYSGKTFKGTVDSIMAGTGSAFSLFPPENATGNYVKVVQRVPVKIILDKDTDPGHVLRVGMSIEPTIIIER